MTRVVRAALLGFIVGCAMNPPAATSSPPAAAAGGDPLSECLKRSTTREDRIHFAQWTFAAISRHPEVRAMSSLTDAQRTEISKTAAGLFTSLLTKSCPNEARAAMQAGGTTAIENGFRVVGESAMTELVSNPDVAAGFAELAKYADNAEITRVLRGNP